MTFQVARLHAKRRPNRTSKPNDMRTVKVDPRVMDAIKRLPGYDPRRVRIIDANTVILENG